MLKWMPVLVWMVVIFSASTDAMSFQHTSRFIEPVIRWIFPNASGEAVHTTVVIVRKCAHAGEYGILALLAWRALRRKGAGPGWNWAQAGWAIFLAFLFAASDEFHQLFVPSREASVRDVLIDTSGALLAVLLIWFFVQRRKERLVREMTTN